MRIRLSSPYGDETEITGRVLLGSRSALQRLLAVAWEEGSLRVRNCAARQGRATDNRTSGLVENSFRQFTQRCRPAPRHLRPPQMRQPGLREAKPSFLGYARRQQSRHEGQGAREGRLQGLVEKQDALHARTSVQQGQYLQVAQQAHLSSVPRSLGARKKGAAS